MDNQNDNWLEDILGQRQENNETAEQETGDTGLTRSDEQELERIVQEAIAENWGKNFETAPEEDADATQFFAPQQSTVPSLDVEISSEPENPNEESPAEEPVSEDDFFQGIFDAVALDSDLLIGNTPVEEAANEDAISMEMPAADAASDKPENTDEVPLESTATATTDTAVEETSADSAAEEAVAEEPQLDADAIIREILAEDPRNREQLSEDAIINTVLAETDAAKEAETDNVGTESEPEAEEPVRKVRPAKKEGYGLFGIPHILSTAVWAAIILFIGITLGRTVWLCAVDLLALGKTGKEATITITEQDTITDVAKKLETVGMIKYSSLFEMFANLTNKSENIVPGTITFDGKLIYDYNALINAMSYQNVPLNTIEVTIPEGYTCKQIFALLEEKGVCSVADLEKYAKEGTLPEYWFLEGIKRDSKYCLEGFLFPDTYEFYLEDQPERVIEKLLSTFDLRFTDRLKEKHEKLNSDLGLNMSMYDIMIMASMVQKEKASDEEGYMIASVFYNRLVDSRTNPNSKYHFLGCDATIDYAEDVFAGNDTLINLYDTYKNRGLPPAPICNPGLSGIDAALEPEDSAYYYFVLDKENNKHVFAKSAAEHEKNLQELGYYD